MSYKFHADAAHGWLEVPLDDVYTIGLSLENFSPYSYREADTLYLEEDRDASIFMNAYKAMKGELPEVIGGQNVQESPIREMEPVWYNE
jgi:hypothetical protein|tara:strand:+ start:261 stop:527 length:267 start_codon:yes stop_codon:yes gene_type:complete